MAIIRKACGSTYQHDWDDDSWTTGTPNTATENLSEAEVFTGKIDLITDGYEGCHITFNIDYASTPTDEAMIMVFGSLDGVNWDNAPLYSLYGVNTVDPCRLSLIIKDLPYLRLSFGQTGSTDAHSLSSVFYKGWRWETV